MSDEMTREEAIDVLQHNYPSACFTDLCEAVKIAIQALSTQPEIIHCGYCRYKDDGIDENGIPFLKCLHGRSYGGTRINDFCSWAKRRTE